MQKEKEFSGKVVNILYSWFNFKSEIWSKSKKYRIDYILTCKDNEDINFGIEFKQLNHKKGEEIGSHLLQSFRYTMEEWEVKEGVFKQIPILLCPPISYTYLICPKEESKIIFDSTYYKLPREHFHDRHEKNHEHHTVNGMIGVFHLGEIRTFETKHGKKIRFMFSNKTIWSSELHWNEHTKIRGINKSEYDFLMAKILGFKI